MKLARWPIEFPLREPWHAIENTTPTGLDPEAAGRNMKNPLARRSRYVWMSRCGDSISSLLWSLPRWQTGAGEGQIARVYGSKTAFTFDMIKFVIIQMDVFFIL